MYFSTMQVPLKFVSLLNLSIQGVMNTPHSKTEDGIEMQLGVNHIGSATVEMLSN